MRKFTLIVCLLLLPCAIMAEKQGKNIRFNIGLKTGFQAITYNDPYFEIDNYKYNENTIQSNKIGYTIAPFFRLSFKRFYIQTEGWHTVLAS